MANIQSCIYILKLCLHPFIHSYLSLLVTHVCGLSNLLQADAYFTYLAWYSVEIPRHRYFVGFFTLPEILAICLFALLPYWIRISPWQHNRKHNTNVHPIFVVHTCACYLNTTTKVLKLFCTSNDKIYSKVKVQMKFLHYL